MMITLGIWIMWTYAIIGIIIGLIVFYGSNENTTGIAAKSQEAGSAAMFAILFWLPLVILLYKAEK